MRYTLRDFIIHFMLMTARINPPPFHQSSQFWRIYIYSTVTWIEHQILGVWSSINNANAIKNTGSGGKSFCCLAHFRNQIRKRNWNRNWNRNCCLFCPARLRLGIQRPLLLTTNGPTTSCKLARPSAPGCYLISMASDHTMKNGLK